MLNKFSSQSQPGLFGISNSNRDFKKPISWGKNIFNNAFPIGLACYMQYKGIDPVYFTLDKNNSLQKSYIRTEDLFAFSPTDDDIYFSFESDFIPYQPFVFNNLPRADLVVMDKSNGICKSAIEIKLTALPDNSTASLSPERYGCVIVTRPDTIVYMALSFTSQLAARRDQLITLFQELLTIIDWTDVEIIAPLIPQMVKLLNTFMSVNSHLQQPLVMQPIWKTEGKKLTLNKDAFDIFVWSNFAFTRLFFREANLGRGTITRGARSVAWLTKMLIDFALEGKFDHRKIIHSMLFNTKNDKAFAVNGMVTHGFMNSEELMYPRIKREEIKNIILGNGEQLLSPERRLDAAIMNTPGLFD